MHECDRLHARQSSLDSGFLSHIAISRGQFHRYLIGSLCQVGDSSTASIPPLPTDVIFPNRRMTSTISLFSIPQQQTTQESPRFPFYADAISPCNVCTASKSIYPTIWESLRSLFISGQLRSSLANRLRARARTRKILDRIQGPKIFKYPPLLHSARARFASARRKANFIEIVANTFYGAARDKEKAAAQKTVHCTRETFLRRR